MSRKFHIFTAAVLFLAGVGFGAHLYHDTVNLLKPTLFFVAVVVVARIVYLLMNRAHFSWSTASSSSSANKKYQKALRHQKQRSKLKKQHASKLPFTTSSSKKRKKVNQHKLCLRRDYPFRVIEGKKNKPSKRIKTS